MKYSYNWLKELSETEKSPKELANLLMLHAFEVEGVEENENLLEGVVVGEILEIEKHPNADKLQITKTKVGSEILQIVCGAKNIAVGDKVPVALVGTTLPASAKDGSGDFQIKEAEIRGVKSFGMLCAEDELGLGASHEGILQLEKNSKVGTPIAEVLGLEDAILEIDILANRAHDALSHVGMAREIAAMEGRKIDYDWDGLKLGKKTSKKLTVTIKDKKISSRYIGAVLENVEVSESPEWLKNRLKISGIRPINNVVDATNYVMLEIGQPLHAFDFEKIAKNGKASITVRNAGKNEEITILDGSIKKLSESDIVISNESEAIALAGVMGGFDSGVTKETRTIVLEAANFAPAAIRRTRMRLGLASDAALRFEKEIDPNLAEKALVRVIEILEHIANAKLEGTMEDYPEKKKTWTIKLELAKAEKLLGVKVPNKESKKILELLGMKVSGSDVLKVEIPTFRLDLTTQEDLIEEIGRIYGYEKIAPQAPLVSSAPAPANEQRVFARSVKNILVAGGFNETYNYSFYSQKDANLAQLGFVKHLELEAPMNPEQAFMRISLIPNILKNIRENLKNHKELHIFEIGRVYWPSENSKIVLPEEKSILVGAMVLEKKSEKEMRYDLRNASTFFEAKAVVDNLLAQLGIVDHYYDNFNGNPIDTPVSLWHQSRSAEIKIEGKEESIGYMGEINPFVLTEFDIHTRVAMFEINMEKLRVISEGEREFQPIRKHPVVVRDISMTAEKVVRIDDILENIQEAGGDIVLDVELFDAIDFADNSSSFAFHIILGADERTLGGKEVEEAMQKIMHALEKQLKVKIRQ